MIALSMDTICENIVHVHVYGHGTGHQFIEKLYTMFHIYVPEHVIPCPCFIE